jgi:hypothetical protein
VRGTYLQGTVRFGAGNRMPDGIIVVDAVGGDGVPRSDLASVTIDPGAPADSSGVWRGWLIVNGALAVDGEVQLRGLVYAQSTLDARAAGTVELSGALVSRNIRDLPGAGIDTGPAADLSIVYNCRDALTGGGKIPGRWSVKGGNYREVAGS